MKKIILFAALAISTQLVGQTLKTPAASPTQTVKQDFALSSIEVSYSRPSAKGRKIYGEIVPFGKMWRTGANSATQITFGEDVKVGGQAVKAGKYSLVTIPNADAWEVVLLKPESNAFSYTKEAEVARFSTKPVALPFKIETFMMVFGDQTQNSVNLSIMWENTEIEFPIVADIETKIMADIDKAMNGDTKPYFAAATFYFENGKDMNKALEWANKAVEMDPKAFWKIHLKAKVLAKSGDKANAIATAMKSIELAKEAKNDDYVAMNEKLIKSLK
ncbi:MAG: DUF2911 domain-containing protein [Leadbetterella sp.]